MSAGPKGSPPPTETEAKLGAFAGFVMPDLTDVVPGIVVRALPMAQLSAVYHDTADLRLARRGVTLRYRVDTGGGTDEKGWTLKFPSGLGAGVTLSRRELSFPGSPAHPPAAAVSLVRALARTAPLQPVGKLVTRRLRWALQVGEDGPVAAELDDDEVSVYEGRRVAARFREIEVEEVDADAAPGILAAVVAALVGAGAGDADPAPKIVRALGPRALTPPTPQVVPASGLGRSSTAGDVVRAAIAFAASRLIEHDAGVRMGEHDEAVHQARVATRRLRSDLFTFRSVLDREWVRGTRDELAWLADTLGHVRDADVLSARLEKAVAALRPDDADAAQALLATLASQRDGHRAALVAAYDSPRYLALLDRLVAAAEAPPWATRVVVVPPADPQPEPERAPEIEPVPPAWDDLEGEPGAGEQPEPPGAEPPQPEPPVAEPPEAEPEPPIAESPLAPEPIPVSEEAVPLVTTPAGKAIPLMVKGSADALTKAVRKLGKHPADEALHDVRRKAKRCRYAVEASVPVVGKDATRLAKAVAGLQEVLGGLQDAVVAEDWLRSAVAGPDVAPATALAAGLLVAAEHAHMEAARRDWADAWKAASDKALWAWLPR